MPNIIRAIGSGSQRTSKSVTFTGASGLGAVGTVTYFNVTGEVLIERIVPYCSVDLTEAGATATCILGVTGSTSLFIGSTNATTIDAGEFWVSTTPTANGIALPATMQNIVITDNVILTVGAQNVNGGALRIDVIWRPLSSDGLLAAA